MRKILLILAMGYGVAHGQKFIIPNYQHVSYDTAIACHINYKAKYDSLAHAYNQHIKLDKFKQSAVIRHARICQKNPSQLKFLVGWINRDLK